MGERTQAPESAILSPHSDPAYVGAEISSSLQLERHGSSLQASPPHPQSGAHGSADCRCRLITETFLPLVLSLESMKVLELASGEAEEAGSSQSWVLGWRSLASAGQPSLNLPASEGDY